MNTYQHSFITETEDKKSENDIPKPEGKRPLLISRSIGRIILKSILRKLSGSVDWIHVDQ